MFWLWLPASPVKPRSIGGIDGKNVYTVRNVADIVHLKDGLEAAGAENTAVIGGGFIGIEVAENLAKAGKKVTVVEAMSQDAGVRIEELRVDGGPTRNRYLMQFQSDLLDVEVVCPDIAETTALGAAALAGLAVGFWKDQEEIRRLTQHVSRYHPRMGEEEREKLMKGWKKAVAAAAAFDIV